MPGTTAMLVFVGVAQLLADPEGAAKHSTDVASADIIQAGVDLDGLDGLDIGTAIDGVPVVRDYLTAVALTEAPATFGSPRWIRHRIRPRERVSQIAARYGVSKDRVIEWNHLDPESPLPPTRKRSLKVFTRRQPAARFEARYVPSQGESWGDVAAALRLEIPDLRAWNWQVKVPHSGKPLTVWVDPAIPWTLDEDGGHEFAAPPKVRDDATSVGLPQRGRLDNGVQLPESDLYSRGHPWVLWGSSYTIKALVAALADFRSETGYQGEIVVGAISKMHGRRLSPHRSHQSGRDVDIRLPRIPGIPETDSPNADEIDWYAAWGMIRAFARSDDVSMIFLEVDLHRRIYEAARVMGESQEDMLDVVMWPDWKNRGQPLVRHASGHDGHIHVRFKCGPNEPKCKTK